MPTTKVPRSEVTLTTVHTHAGEDCKKGDKIKVTAKQKAWLLKRKLIEGEG